MNKKINNIISKYNSVCRSIPERKKEETTIIVKKIKDQLTICVKARAFRAGYILSLIEEIYHLYNKHEIKLKELKEWNEFNEFVIFICDANNWFY